MEKAKTGSNGGGWSRHTQDNGVKHWEENKNFFPSAPALLRPHLLCVAHSVCVYMRRRDPQRHRPKGPILRRPSANNPIPFPLWYPKGMAASRDFAGSRVTAFDVLVCCQMAHHHTSSSSVTSNSNSMAASQQQGTAGGGSGDQNFDYMFKLLIIGNSSVGKTSFLFRYCDDSFTSAFVSTVGIDFKVKTVFRGDKRVKLQIWDTAGQERYRTITTAYYRGAMGFILMYDITNEESFNSVQDWCTQIKTYSWENAQVVLVGNKCDMEDERIVSYERGKQLADQLGLEFFEASAKENINVKAVFEKLVEIICNKMAESLDQSQQQAQQAQGHRLDANTGGTQKPAQQQCNC